MHFSHIKKPWGAYIHRPVYSYINIFYINMRVGACKNVASDEAFPTIFPVIFKHNLWKPIVRFEQRSSVEKE